MAHALLRSSLGWFTSPSIFELNGEQLIQNLESELEVNNLYSAFAIHAVLYKIASVASDPEEIAESFRSYVCSAETEYSEETLSRLLNNELSHALDSHFNGSEPSRLMRLGLEILSDGWPSSLDDMAVVLSVLTPSGYTQDLRMDELQEMKSGSKVLEMMNKKVEEYLKHDSKVALPSLYKALRACPAPGIEPGSQKLHISCRIIGNTSNLQLHGDCPVIEQKFCTAKDLRENTIDLEPIYQYVEALNLADDMDESDSEAKTTSAETRGMNTENSVKLGDGEQSKECIELAKNCLENTQSPSKSIKDLPGKLEDYAYVIDCLVSPNCSDSHLVWEKGVPRAYIEYEKKMIEHNNLICRTGKWSNWLGELVITDTKAIMEYRQSANRKSQNKRPKAARMIMTVLAKVLVSNIQEKEKFCSHLLLLLSGNSVSSFIQDFS